MADSNSKNISYPSQFAIFLGLTGAAIMVATLATFAVWNMMTGLPFPTKTEDLLQPKFYNVNMVMQAVTTFLIFFMPVHFFALICYRNPYQYLGFNNRFNFKQTSLVFGILILAFPLSGALSELTKIILIPAEWETKFKAMELARQAQEAALIHIDSIQKLFISLLVIALLPAIFEETFFRGGLQNLLTRWFKGPWAAIILTSIIFSLVHLSYYGFLVRFTLGLVLGFIFYYSKNLWLPILLHFLFNAIQVLALYITTLAGVKDKKDLEASFPLWAGALAILLILYLFKLYRTTSQIQLSKYAEQPIIKEESETHHLNSNDY